MDHKTNHYFDESFKSFGVLFDKIRVIGVLKRYAIEMLGVSNT